MPIGEEPFAIADQFCRQASNTPSFTNNFEVNRPKRSGCNNICRYFIGDPRHRFSLQE